MKSLLSVVLPLGLICAGCESGPAVRQISGPRSSPAPPPRVSPRKVEPAKPSPTFTEPSRPIVTPVETLTAKVVSYNEAGRFVVLNFPLAQMPGVERRLFIYRQGAKVGEVKITGPQRDNITVADLISGEAQPGDEVKDN